MSEHIEITGECNYIHMPLGEKGGFTYCHHCNKTLRKLSLTLHEGFASDWIQAVCPVCQKTIWIAGLTTDPKEKEYKKDHGCKHLVIDDLKCIICKKKTNRFDCYAYTYGDKDKIYPRCSAKCDNIETKRMIKKWEKRSKNGNV
jgi:hypothetical protein